MKETKDGLQIFLYVLMRDHLPVGAVRGIICEHVAVGQAFGASLTDEHLSALAEEIAGALRWSKRDA